MKTYKHRTLWWIAKPCTVWWFTVVVNDTDWDRVLAYYIDDIKDTLHYKIIEADSNREEVVETKDWVDEVYKTLEEDYDWCFEYTEVVEHLRQAIEKHAPIVKKFTMEDIERWTRKNMYPDHERSIVLNEFKFFFRVNWLLEE